MIKLCWSNDVGRGDFEQDATSKYLLEEDGLETFVLYSLFTDARPLGEHGYEARGWWGDDFSEGETFGARLWHHIDRGVLTNAVIEQARKAAQDALEWMVRDGIAATIAVSASRAKRNSLQLEVDIVRTNGSRWNGRWEAQLNALE